MIHTGWLPDPPVTAEQIGAGNLHAETLAAGDIPPDGGLTREPWILDQRGESCTGHFGAEAIWLLTGDKASPYMPWYFARAYDAHGSKGVHDTGCSASAFMRALREHGACDFNQWNPTSAELNDIPPALARLHAQRRNLDLQPLYGDVDTLVRAVAGALAVGHPVGLTLHADDSFKRIKDRTTSLEPSGADANHIVTVTRYQTMDDGTRQFLLVNSWGNDWGLGGRAWVTEAWVRASSFVVVAKGVS